MPVRTFRAVARLGAPVIALSAATCAVVVLLMVFLVQATEAGRMEESADVAAAAAQNATSHALGLLQAMTDAETGQRGFLLTGRPEFLEPYRSARARVDTALAGLGDAAIKDPTYAAALPDLREQAHARLQIIDRTIVLAHAGARDEAMLFLPQGKAGMDELRRRVGVVAATARAREQSIRADQRAFHEQARKLQLGLAAATVVALLIAISALAAERATAARAGVDQAAFEAELRHARDRAQEADHAKSRFLATASHDLRQPLHAMALYIAALERRVESEQARDILANMDGAVRSMTRLFTALLDLARLEAGVLKPEREDFPIVELLREVAARSADPRAKAGVTIEVVNTTLQVHTDPDLLEIALRNLASNAVKHSRGGKVLLGCRRVGDQVRIEVHDNGQGIPPDQLKKLFSEFVRGEQARSTEGVGLGLAIVERMAKLLGHGLSVRSQEGRGSVFAVSVPRAAAQTPNLPLAKAVSKASLQGVRVLVADDEPLALDAMRQALADAGAQVTAAPSAPAALALESRFDLYIFDLNLDREDGLDTLAELERRHGGPLRGMIVTGATTPEILERLKGSGRAWLTKPLAGADFVAAASALLVR